MMNSRLTIRLLVSGASTRTAELLGLATTGIGNEKGTVELDEDVLDLLLALFIDICKRKDEGILITCRMIENVSECS